MDLCAEFLLRELQRSGVDANSFSPRFSKPFSTLLSGRTGRMAFNAERLWNRFVSYPISVRRFLRKIDSQINTSNSTVGAHNQRRIDAFHVVDHTYAQLVHALPSGRTGVYCHDLDAFRSILDPDRERRPWWYRAMAERQLSGLKKAALVFHNSLETGVQLRRANLIDPDRLIYCPLGIADEFLAAGQSVPTTNDLATTQDPWLLHVGSAIPRKRVDVLLNAFSRARHSLPSLRLVKVGGQWSPEHERIIESNGLAPFISHPSGLSRKDLADLYRTASLVLVPSEAEGFGLPVIEAMACGAPVLCSDLPVLREVGGTEATFVSVGDSDAWAVAIVKGLKEGNSVAAREARIKWAGRYSWENHAKTIADAYRDRL